MRKRVRQLESFSLICVMALVVLPAASAQIAGQLSGTVADAGGASIPGATVTVTQALSKQARVFETVQNGSFIFPGLLTGTYDLRIEKPGFTSYQQKDIAIASQENLDLHEIRLTVGQQSTSITVKSEGARIQTDSSDRISRIEAAMVADMPNPGRSFLAATRTIPGTQSTSPTDGGGVNGGLSGWVGLQLDGITQQNSGAPASTLAAARMVVNVDAINEVQVQVNAMNAETGSRAGGQILVTTKSGTSQFHGTLYMILRNEDLNANAFFSNKTGVVRPKARFQNPGGTIGGPVIIPGASFKKFRNKIFFFYAEDQLFNKSASTQSYSMPTALEKAGNFSQTVTTRGVLIPILDSTAGLPFPGNIVPTTRFSREGQALLNLFPAPGGGPSPSGVSAPLVIDPTGNRAYNTRSSFVTNSPQSTHTARIDFNLAASTTAYFRLILPNITTEGVGAGQVLAGTNWGYMVNTNPVPGHGWATTVVHTFRPNLIGEFTVGTNYVFPQNKPLDAAQFAKVSDLSNLKYLDGTTFKPTEVFGASSQNFIPSIMFSNNRAQNAGQAYTGGAPAYGFDNRWPWSATDQQANYTANFTWVKGSHNMKAGFTMEHLTRDSGTYAKYTVNGTYYFGSDNGNPLDTGYPISNLLTGVIQSYGQDNVKQSNHSRYYQYEWFLQDSWKVSRRLSIDYGVRFSLIPQTYSAGADLGLFDGTLYSASKTGQLLFPKCTTALPASGVCPVKSTVAVNPVTGASYNGGQVGLFDPKSYASGSFPYSGIRMFPDGHIFDTQPPQIGPRFGFAYDVFGNGKTAIRGAFGIFYQRAFSSDIITSSAGGVGPIKIPPNFQTPTYYNTTFSDLSTALAFYGPQIFYGGSPKIPNPTTYNWNFNVQQDIGMGFVLEAAYVGNASRHGESTGVYNANPVPPGTTWSPIGGTCNAVGNCSGTLNPAYLDPTRTGQTLDINLIRSRIGYNGASDIPSFTSSGTSNYHSLQVQLKRRFGKRLMLGSNWTWQKTTTYAQNQYLPDRLMKNVLNRKQAVNINVTYALPSVARFVGRNAFTEGVFGGWRLDSVMSFFSGNPWTVGCGVPTGAPAGYPNGQSTISGSIPFRCAMTGTTFLPAGSSPTDNGYPATVDPRLWYPINIKSFPLPALSTYGFGNTPSTLFWGPGFENVDMSIFKSFNIGKESRQLELRMDATNLFNHFNPGDPNLNLSYNWATGAQQTANFGQITSQQGSPRTMSVTLKFRF